MSYTDKLQQIEQIKQTIEKHGKLPDEVLKKINYKLRLEWNYTSNSMEGNSLTKQETRSVMVGNITVEGKPIKDVLEMKGHDEVITKIIQMGKGELNISEGRIKEIHKGIMHEEDPEKKKEIGVWKKNNNYLYNYKNERFDFVAPADVPDKMHQLINWLNGERDKIKRGDKDALHPVQLAFQFHLDYISIHPFYDGNGRTVRILTNLVLISYGYPPIYVKENEKAPYYQYLADIQGYGGNPDLFYDFMAGLLVRSLQIVLDAVVGKDIEEHDDLEKEIALWKRDATSQKVDALHRNDDIVNEIYYKGVKEMFEEFAMKHKQFFDLFKKSRITSFKNNTGRDGLDWLTDEITRLDSTEEDNFKNIWVEVRMEEYKYNVDNPFSIVPTLMITFEPFKYIIRCRDITIDKNYGYFLSMKERQKIVSDSVKVIFNEIKTKAGK
jgi:Fic family protein